MGVGGLVVGSNVDYGDDAVVGLEVGLDLAPIPDASVLKWQRKQVNIESSSELRGQKKHTSEPMAILHFGELIFDRIRSGDVCERNTGESLCAPQLLSGKVLEVTELESS